MVRELLAIRPGERVAIMRDAASPAPMVAALRQVLRGDGLEPALLTQPSRPAERKNDLCPMIARALEAADVPIAIAGSGGAPVDAPAVRALLAAKRLRFLSMVMRDMAIFTGGGALADHPALHAEGLRLRARRAAGRAMRITSAAGTEIAAPIAQDAVFVECGPARAPGETAAFSGAGVSLRPLEGLAEGVFVIDGPGAVIG
ncbi:hypothetical protein [Paralimibaculum aggregatum]|uniref:hypothetical protein n=1 Tax=Paralimibaculum aggregatum TaxID=3036245 RepID=UPI0025540C84|nr:hypothetical protein [Limibaculum sp. NKW23]